MPRKLTGVHAQQAEAETRIDATLKGGGSNYERPTFELRRLENSELVYGSKFATPLVPFRGPPHWSVRRT